MPPTGNVLTVHLERDGDRLGRTYRVRDRLLHRSNALCSSLGSGYRFESTRGLAAIALLLDRGNATELAGDFSRGRLAEAGEILFTTLFGEPKDRGAVFRGLFDQPDGPEPPPISGAVRLRIVTSDPELLGMPWRITSWQGKRLVEGVRPWTFEVALEALPGQVAHLPVPARILVLAPEVAGLRDLDTAGHLAELREAVFSVSPRYRDPAYFRTVETKEDLIAAVRGMQPHVVYYYGHAEVEGGQACLSLAGEKRVKRSLIMDDLKRILMPPPLAVFLNGCMSGASGWHSAGHKLSPDVALVLANRTTAWTGRAGPAAVRWIQDLLRGADDPVALLDTIDAAESTQGFQWATTIVHTAYQTWTAGESDEEPRPPLGLRLDRTPQRTAALGQVSGLTRGREKRVEAMVVYGEAGNHVEQTSEQVLDYLETHGRQLARVKRLRLGFPDLRVGLAAGLEGQLRSALSSGPDDVLQYVLRTYLPHADASRPVPLLWIDWGTFGPGAQRALSLADLGDWLEMASTLLARECPAECRIVSFLSIITAKEKHRGLETWFDERRMDLTTNAFGCQLLPKLGGLEVIDLYEYLREPRNTGCPPNLARTMAKLLHEAEGGNYEKTVASIHEAERTTWIRLKARLEAQGGRSGGGEDTTL